jgi:hypothetical protein
LAVKEISFTFVKEIKNNNIMGRLADNLENATNKVKWYEYETSEEITNKKLELGKEIYKMLLVDEDGFSNGMDLTDTDLTIEGEYYDKYTDYYNPCCKKAIVSLTQDEDGNCLVEDEDGDEYYFVEDLTLAEVENIYNEVKEIIEFGYGN